MIKTFKQFIEESSSGRLSVYDMDDTLIRSPHIRVGVKDASGKRIGSLSTHEFANHVQKPGHSYDFSDFNKAKQLEKSTPIPGMINHINNAQATARKSPNHKVVIVTARADLDSGPRTIKALKKHGISDMEGIHLHRAGNVPGNAPDAEKKLTFIRKHLDNHPYKEVHMYDDSKKNLDAFHTLRKEYPKTTFKAHHIDEKGNANHYEPKQVNENTVRDASGKLINNKKVAIRMANGKIEMQDPGKSGSSGGGGY